MNVLHAVLQALLALSLPVLCHSTCLSWCNKYTCDQTSCNTCTLCSNTRPPPAHLLRPPPPAPLLRPAEQGAPHRFTHVSIVGDEFHVNGHPTFKGRHWQGASMQGLLPNARMVNAIFDDLNVDTKTLWNYPDTGTWDPDRNTNELVAALDDYAAHGLMAITVNVQGGSPCGNNPADDHPPCGAMYGRDSSGFDALGGLRPGFFSRLEKIITRADELGMCVFLQLFYPDEARKIFNSNNDAVIAAADNTVDWLLDHGYTNVLLDVCNECDLCRIAYRYCPEERLALKSLHWSATIHDWDKTYSLEGTHGELLERMRHRARARGVRLLLSTSYVGGNLPEHDNTGTPLGNGQELKHFDYVNIHGNNLWAYKDGNLIEMVDQLRRLRNYRTMPIVITEDDGLCAHDGTMKWPLADKAMHDPANTGPQGVACYFHFDTCTPTRNTKCAFGNAVFAKVSWGLFLSCCGFATCPAWSHDYERGESYQCPPINWQWDISPTKRKFFLKLKEATGGLKPFLPMKPPPTSLPLSPMPSPPLPSPPPPPPAPSPSPLPPPPPSPLPSPPPPLLPPPPGHPIALSAIVTSTSLVVVGLGFIGVAGFLLRYGNRPQRARPKRLRNQCDTDADFAGDEGSMGKLTSSSKQKATLKGSTECQVGRGTATTPSRSGRSQSDHAHSGGTAGNATGGVEESGIECD